MLLFRTLVRIAIPTLAVLDLTYGTWWATAAGNAFTFWAVSLLVTGALVVAGYLAGADYDLPEYIRFDTWTSRLYLTTALLLSVGAGWWGCTSAILLGWFFWAVGLEAANGEPESKEKAAPTIPQHHLN